MGTPARSPYATAIDEAREAIVARARLYKWLVIAVSLGLVAVAIAAAWQRSAWPLLGLGLLPPAVLAHRLADLRVVHRWRSNVIGAWARGDLSLPLLASTLGQVPALPESTVQGMLQTLPAWPAPQAGDGRTAVLLETQQALGHIAEHALAVRALAWLAALGIGGLARVPQRGGAGAGRVPVATMVPAWTWWAGLRLRRTARQPDRAGIGAARFNWNGVPGRLGQAWPPGPDQPG